MFPVVSKREAWEASLSCLHRDHLFGLRSCYPILFDRSKVIGISVGISIGSGIGIGIGIGIGRGIWTGISINISISMSRRKKSRGTMGWIDSPDSTTSISITNLGLIASASIAITTTMDATSESTFSTG
jgi:hypothetical protein